MSEAATKLPAKTDKRTASPFESLRRQVDRIFDDFHQSLSLGTPHHPLFDIAPFWSHDKGWTTAPVVDVAETDKAYEITAELPGMDANDIELKFARDTLTIRGEKKEEKEEKKKDYYLSERSYGSFQRTFQVPEGVDPDKIEASFEKGVLKVTLPKTPQAQTQEKRSQSPQNSGVRQTHGRLSTNESSQASYWDMLGRCLCD